MKLNEIIKTTATLLAREDVCEYLLNPENETQRQTYETVDLLTRLANLVIKELAEGFICMVDEISVNDFSVRFSSLNKSILSVIGAYDQNGNKLDYTLSKFGVSSNNKISTLKYSFTPENYGLEDTIGEFEKKVTAGVLSYGVCAEYCLTQGKFDEAIMWNQRYTDSIDLLIRPKNANLKGRAFL